VAALQGDLSILTATWQKNRPGQSPRKQEEELNLTSENVNRNFIEINNLRQNLEVIGRLIKKFNQNV
jgi:hypothetical protein